MTNEQRQKRWMQRNVENYVDDWGEVKMTELAQDCCIELFNRAAEEDDFFMAYEVGTWWEKYDKKRTQSPSPSGNAFLDL